MGSSSMGQSDVNNVLPVACEPVDAVSLRRWFLAYAVFLLAEGVPLYFMLMRLPFTWNDWVHDFVNTFRHTPVAVKLLVVLLYVSFCTTVTPMPTGWVVAGMATHEAAVAGNVWTVTLLVASVGALGSTIANMNDYYFFTWLLRSRHVAKIRQTKLYSKSATWFDRSPFFLVTVFNLIPIPVDVVRLLAITHRYPRVPFAAANFIGRFCRYSIFAWVTYYFSLGWIAPVALLALAIVLGLIKLVPAVVRKLCAPHKEGAA